MNIIKKNIVLIAIIAAAVVLIWLWQQGILNLGQQQQTVPGDTTAEIQQQIDQVDLGDLDAEFQGIDKDLNNL